MKRCFSRISPLGLLASLSLATNVTLLLVLYKQYQEAYIDVPITDRPIFRTLLEYNDSNSWPSQPRLEQTVSKFDIGPSTEAEAHDRHYNLAVMISSAPGYIERRNAVRRTWMKGYSKPPRKFFTKFLIGTGNLDTKTIQELEEENSQHHDMVLLHNLEDKYQNLAYKTLAGLVWFDRNVNYSYVLKCDDDTFVTPDRIEDELLKRDHSQGLYWGYFVGYNTPLKVGKWAELKWKFCDTYFPYAYGGGYVLSADVVHRIAANADAMIVYNNEDVSVGAWTVIYDIERRHDVRFDSSYTRGCKNDFLTTHQPELKNFVERHQLFSTSGILCRNEGASEQIYNWDMPPSKCYNQ